MCLSAEKIEAIKQSAGHVFGPYDDLCLLSQAKEQHGFTLVELITIMVIVGILAVAAAPRFLGNNVFQERGAADQVVAALRYGQKVAIAQHLPVVVSITAAAASNCGAVLAGGAVNCAIANSVTVVPALPQAVTFDALGRPNAAASMVVGATAINVEAETGYVH